MDSYSAARHMPKTPSKIIALFLEGPCVARDFFGWIFLQGRVGNREQATNPAQRSRFHLDLKQDCRDLSGLRSCAVQISDAPSSPRELPYGSRQKFIRTE